MQFFRNITIRTRLFFLVAVLCLFTAAVSAIGYIRLKGSERDLTDMYFNQLLPVQWMNDARAQIQGIRGDLLEMMLNKDRVQIKALMDDIEKRRKLDDENLANYWKIDVDQFEIAKLKEGEKHLADFRKTVNRAIELSLENKTEEAYATFLQNVKQPLENFNAVLQELANYSIDESRRTYEENLVHVERAEKIIFLFALLSLIVGASFGFLTARSITRPVNAVAEILKTRAGLDFRFDRAKAWLLNYQKNEIAGMVGSLFAMEKGLTGIIARIADAANQLSSDAEEFSSIAEESNAGLEESRSGMDDIASQVENLAAAGQEINASVEEVAGGAQTAAQKASEMASDVELAVSAGEEGKSAIEGVVQSVSQIAREAGGAASEIKKLGDRAREIQTFVTQIGGIADQTNLLALNAAIEAARAGEAGRGFAVVAEEVRKLAEESNEAAKKIAELAGAITKDLDWTVSSAQKNSRDSEASLKLATATQSTIDRMMDALAHISSSTQDLAAVAQEQAASSEEIAGAIQNIASRVTATAASSEKARTQMDEVARSAERVAGESEELAALSENLNELAGLFKIDEDGEPGGLLPLTAGEKQKR